MSLASRVRNNTGIGLLGSCLVTVGVLTKTVILGRALSLEDFGLYVICLNAVVILKLFLNPGLGPTLLRYIPEFEAEDSQEKVSSLVCLCGYLALICFLIFGSVFLFGSAAISSKIYRNPSISDLLLILGIASSAYLLTTISTTLLRVTDNFKYTLIHSFLGSMTIPIILIFLRNQGALNLRNAIIATAIGELVSVAIACLISLILLRRLVIWNKRTLSLAPIKNDFKSLRGTLGQTSVFGILQAGAQAGGIFLLGVFGTPVQVAIGGMAVQMARPLAMFQTSLSAAIAPELNRLHADGKMKQLFHFLKRYMLGTSICMALGFLFISVFGPSLISALLKPSYGVALPVFLVLLLTFGLRLIFQPFMVIAIARDEVGRRNLYNSLRFLYLGVAVWAGISAMGVMLALLAGNLTVRIFSDFPMYRRLRSEMS